MFACPNCKEKLKLVKSSHLQCINKSCHLPKKIFPIINKIPILIPFNLKDCIFEESYSENFINFGSRKRDSSSIKMKIKKTAKDLIYGKNIKTIKNYKYLADHLKKDSKILIIGGGTIGSGADYFLSVCKKKAIKVDSIDVYFSQNITAVADAHYLPFENESYQLVIIQAVLEHVINPNRVVEEIYRILANNAIVYAETPFMQCVHEGPYDFTRFSHSGHRWLFKKFKEISSGAHHGAFSSSLFILSYAISGLMRNKTIGILIRIFFTRFSKFLDLINDYKSNIDVACGTYFLGIKSNDYSNEKNQIKIGTFYKGAQKK
ncbi:methyltransferase domain-containing protein [uncultured Prochlorococcus sp.]|uniref:methyltransferase domain-containing protein n=1 Tax=uncultured Prochlorococcus sp. TaxID=159733 RepID=UPI00258B084C|nr:methyltransferase domain-containing protein [uncultured Prochlorococcus sp.]